VHGKFQASALLETQRNKTDKNDARGLAQIVRMGGSFIRPVVVRSQNNQEARMLLTMRQHLVEQKVALENNITGSMKPFGLITPRGHESAKKFRESAIGILYNSDGFVHADIAKRKDISKLCQMLLSSTPSFLRPSIFTSIGKPHRRVAVRG